VVDSISKTPVDREAAEAVVDAAFGGGVSLVDFTECTEGWFNAVHRLGLSDGTACVLKVAPPPDVRVMTYEHDLITTEVDALRLVRERTDAPVPAVLAWDDSRTLLPSPWFLMEECPGVLLGTLRPTLTLEEQGAIDAQVIRHLADLHAITAPTFGRPDPTALRDVTWSGAFIRLIDDLVADAVAADVELPVAGTEIAALVRANAAELDEVTTPSFVPWDLWDLNVFVDPSTRTVVGLIDFERVLWADPLMEVQFLGKRADDDVVVAYGRPLFAAPGAATRRRLYDLYLYLVMVVECAYRSYPTDETEQFARPMLDAVLVEIRSV
jgi:aminoglycoside phosphotransferase (APT) family kinase protein